MKNTLLIALTSILLLVVIVFSVVPAIARPRRTLISQEPGRDMIYFGTGGTGNATSDGCCSPVNTGASIPDSGASCH